MNEERGTPIRINIKDEEESRDYADTPESSESASNGDESEDQTASPVREEYLDTAADSADNGSSVTADTETADEAVKEEPPESPADKPDDSADSLQSQLEAAQREAKENYERFLRMSADFENFKKRSAREMESVKKFANEKLIIELLPIADNLERAIESSNAVEGDDGEASKKENGTSIVEGVNMVYKELLKVFEKFGVTAIGSMGQPFDPGVHEAVMQEPSNDVPENTVIREFHKGYMLNDRLIRPAMVVVSKQANQ